MLETRESVRLGDQIYKIGKSKQEAFKRFDQYPTGSILITYEMCFDCDKIEKQLIKMFNTKYKNVSIYGKEYFHGNLADMRADIFNCINQEYRQVTEKSKNANIISNLKTVNSFDELVKQQGKETIAETKMTLTNSTSVSGPINENNNNSDTNNKDSDEENKLVPTNENNNNIINKLVPTNENNSNCVTNCTNELEQIEENNDSVDSDDSNDSDDSDNSNNCNNSDCKSIYIKGNNTKTNKQTKPEYICVNCGKIYGSRVGLWKYNKICVPKVVEKKYICTYCHKNFSCRQSKWAHEKTCPIKKQCNLTAINNNQNKLNETIDELKNKIIELESYNKTKLNEIEV